MCIVINKDKPALTETFIQNHIDHLASVILNLNSHRFKPIQTRIKYLNYVFNGIQRRIKYSSIKQFLRKNEVDFVLAEYGMVGADCYDICKQLSLPLIIHFHGHDAHRKTILSRYQKKYEKAFGYAKAIVVVSTSMKEKLLALKAPKEKVHLNIYGVNTKLFSPANIEQSPQVLFSAGRFVDKKAPYLTILAFQKALEKVPDAKLIMAGDGYLLESCQRLIKALNIKRSVELIGPISQALVAENMQNSRAFVQHSVVANDGDSEGTPNTILEAGASGIPVISTRHAGIQDVIIEEKTGLLVDEGDVIGMANHMIKLLQNPKYASFLGQNAAKHINEKHSLETSIRKLKKIIES